MDINVLIGLILRWGVLLSLIITVIGEFVLLSTQAGVSVGYDVFQGQVDGLTSFSAVMHGLMQFKGKALTQLGILFLLATPILRIVFSCVAFFLERDRIYVLISTIVLLLILLSIFIE
ncbi:MAG: DUF1634 domain-containing protein [Flavobacteriales bacterium AspAUS03]